VGFKGRHAGRRPHGHELFILGFFVYKRRVRGRDLNRPQLWFLRYGRLNVALEPWTLSDAILDDEREMRGETHDEFDTYLFLEMIRWMSTLQSFHVDVDDFDTRGECAG
jgi:hypothetical protein